MSTTIPPTIKQRTREITLADRTVIVRRMKRKDAVAFMKQLAGYLTGLKLSGEEIMKALPTLITEVDALSIRLLVATTDLNEAALDDLDLVDYMNLLEASVALNLGEELKNSFAGIVDNLTALMPASKTNIGE